MASPELTSTLTIIDKSSNVLDAIGKEAEKTSGKISNLLSVMEKFGNNTISDGIERSFKNVEKSIGTVEKSFGQQNLIAKTIKETEKSLDSMISELEKELSKSFKNDSDDNFISNTAHEAAMEQIQKTFEDSEKLFKDFDKNLKTFDDAVVKKKKSLEQSSRMNIGFDKRDLAVIKQKFGDFSERIKKPFGSLMQSGYKFQAAISVVTMAIDRFSRMLQLADKNSGQIARFNMLANAEGLSGDASKKRGEQMRKRTSMIATELGISTVDFNDQIMGFANNAAFKSFEEASKFATILNKSFKAAGTGAQEADGAVRQLLQGLSKGRLQGEDLMSILSSAPQVGALLEQAVARLDGKKLDAYRGKVRELASEGRLTADVIKDAFFGASDQIDKDFKSMPMTFETAMTKLKNVTLEAFQPVLKSLSEFINSEEFKQFMEGISTVVELIGKVASTVTTKFMPAISNVFGSIGNVLSGKAFKRDVLKDYKKKDKTEEAVTNQTAVQKMNYQKIYDAQTDMIEAMYEENDILKGMSDQQKKYYQTAGRGLGSLKEQTDSFLANVEEEMVKNAFKTDPELASRFGYDKESDTFKKDITWDDYMDVWLNKFGGFEGENAIKYHSTAELRASGDKISKLQSDIETLKALSESEAFKIYRDRINSDTAWQNGGRGAANFADPETQARFNELTHEAMRITKSKNLKDLLTVNYEKTIDNIASKMDRMIKDESAVTKLLNSLFGESNKFAEGTEKNTRSVHINRDDIEFMKSMTTAEVINRYNTLSSSIVQNNHFAQAPTSSSFGNITARGIQAASNSARALVGA